MSKARTAISIFRQNGLLPLLRSFSSYIRRTIKYYIRILADPWFHKYSIKQLNSKKEGEEDLEDIIRTAYDYEGKGFYDNISPIQHPDELQELAREVNKYDPEVVVEIGTDRGGTLYVWSRYLNAEQIISIDIDYDVMDNSRDIYRGRRTFMSQFIDDSHRTDMRFLEANSQDEITKSELERIVGDHGIDFLFIDGDHSYEGVKNDFQLYQDLVNPGGIIAFHDIINNPSGVPELWEEIKSTYDTREIYFDTAFESLPHVEPFRQKRLKSKCGIGVIYT